jgi:integrase/recombinase XerD
VPESLLNLDELLASWLIALRGERKSPSTLKVYRAGVTAYLEFCAANGLPAELTKPCVRAYMASLADAEPATARLRLTAIKLFARWLAEEEGFNADGIVAIRAPKLDDKAVPDLDSAEVKRLLAACAGAALRDRRDRAAVVLFVETGLRAAELLALDITDVDLTGCTLHVRRGKGGKGRNVRFSPSAAAVMDRYVRARRATGAAGDSGPLWIGVSGRRLTYTGMVNALKTRAATAGIVGFHIHRLRHTAAVRWLSAGGTETGLMAQSGWASRKMIDRYVKSAAEDLAAAEFDRLGMGVELDK